MWHLLERCEVATGEEGGGRRGESEGERDESREVSACERRREGWQTDCRERWR